MAQKQAPLRMAVIGASRGKTFIDASKIEGIGIELAAICDRNEGALEPWRNLSGVRTCTDYDEILADSGIDAVCLATPVPLHARQAIEAMNAGKHVLSEVTAGYAVEELHELVATVERTGCTYMLAENYCFREPVMQVAHMVSEGIFGDIIHAGGAYVHDCRQLYFNSDGSLTWRGELQRQKPGNWYPTHSLGPVAQWLGIGKTDRFSRAATWHSKKTGAIAHYAEKYLDQVADPAMRQADYWSRTMTTSLLHTASGVLAEIIVDTTSPRPHNMVRYELQGTTASFCLPDSAVANRHPLVWIEGKSPSRKGSEAHDWEPLEAYADQWQHPLWREHGARAKAFGHGGGDYFVLLEFADAIQQGRPPLIDVYDAVTWSCLTPLSVQSIEQGNTPVDYPDFYPAR